jgi:hypothetical protein
MRDGTLRFKGCLRPRGWFKGKDPESASQPFGRSNERNTMNRLLTSLVQLGLAAGCYWCLRLMYQEWKAERENRS